MTLRVVLVDDHELMRDALRVRLSRSAAGLEVVGEACNASEALAEVGKTLPDLVVLDLNLPDQDGASLAAVIRSTWPKTKILVLTGDSNEAVVPKAIRAGADGLIRKEDVAGEIMRAIPAVMAGQSYFSPRAATAIVHELRKRPEPRGEGSGPQLQLSYREKELLHGLAEGLAYKEIAAGMGVSVRTAETYRMRLVRKLGCSTRAELVRYAVRNGLAEP